MSTSARSSVEAFEKATSRLYKNLEECRRDPSLARAYLLLENFPFSEKGRALNFLLVVWGLYKEKADFLGLSLGLFAQKEKLNPRSLPQEIQGLMFENSQSLRIREKEALETNAEEFVQGFLEGKINRHISLSVLYFLFKYSPQNKEKFRSLCIGVSPCVIEGMEIVLEGGKSVVAE